MVIKVSNDLCRTFSLLWHLLKVVLKNDIVSLSFLVILLHLSGSFPCLHALLQKLHFITVLQFACFIVTYLCSVSNFTLSFRVLWKSTLELYQLHHFPAIDLDTILSRYLLEGLPLMCRSPKLHQANFLKFKSLVVSGEAILSAKNSVKLLGDCGLWLCPERCWGTYSTPPDLTVGKGWVPTNRQ